jgi:chemosensory pili system protein ChpA (sensor histidine kinase/response regulator)
MVSASQQSRSLARAAVELQSHVDLICVDAMEMQRESPDRNTVESILQTLRIVRDIAVAAGAHPIVEAAALVEEAVNLALTETSAPAPYLGHFITAEAADLARVVHAIASNEDPAPILLHARATLSSMPRRGTDYLVEIDLNNAVEVARIFEAMGDSEPSDLPVCDDVAQLPFVEPQSATQQLGRVRELRQLLASYVAQAESLAADPERGETIDALLNGVKALRASASAAGVRSVERLAARLAPLYQAVRVLNSPVDPDVVEVTVAGGHAIAAVIDSADPASAESERLEQLTDDVAKILRRYNVPASQFQTSALGTGRIGGPAPDSVSRPANVYEALNVLERAHGGGEGQARSAPGRTRGDPERFVRDVAEISERFPTVIEGIETDRASVSGQAALWNLLIKLKETSALAGASVFLDQCWRLESALNKLNGAPLTDEVIAGVQRLSTDLHWLVSQLQPESFQPVIGTELPARTRIDAGAFEQVTRLTDELVVRAGGGPQRSRRFGQTVQDIAIAGDRLGGLLDRLRTGDNVLAVTRELAEIVSDLSISAADLDHIRIETDAADQRLGQVVSRLAEWKRSLHLTPVSAFGLNAERAVRGLTQRQGKSAAFVLEGGDELVDAAFIEPLNSALLHLIRNAIDHGIEAPSMRRSAGKPPRGTLRLSARRDGACILLEVSDDGAGIDEQRVLEQAFESGYPLPDEGLTRDRALQLLFLPGFSLRPVASSPPVKGHGLDVVGQLVAGMKGTVSIDSEVGRGTTVTIRLPLALPTTSSAVVTVAGEHFALPFVNVQVVPTSVVHRIQQKGTTFLADLGQVHVPIVDLGSLLGLRAGHHVRDEGGTILRVQQPGAHWLVKVDDVLGVQDIELGEVANPSGQFSGVVGSATLVSGEPALVLDLDQLLDARRTSRRRKGRYTATLTSVPFALVADMSITSRRGLTQVLDQAGWRAVEARDGLDAWDLLESILPDLLVIDLDLPLLDPFQVIRAAKSGDAIPVIALVTNINPELRAKALNAGVDVVLLKPVNYDDLITSLEALNRQRGGDESSERTHS